MAVTGERDPYEVLGIDDPDSAVWEDIYAAHRRRVMATHPDRGGSVEAFREVQVAYETLLRWDHEIELYGHVLTDVDEGWSADGAGVEDDPDPVGEVPMVVPRVRGAWRRRRAGDAPGYVPRRGAPEPQPRRAAP